MSYPSIKSLEQIGDVDAKLARKILLCKNREELTDLRVKHFELFQPVENWLRQCYSHPGYHRVKMEMLNVALRTYGVEYIKPGKGAKSPAIEYCNSGDTYAPTLLFINGRYSVGNWGDIVERGNYA